MLVQNGLAQRGQLEHAFGVRMGSGLGVTFQYFHTDEHVFEAFVLSQNRGYNFTALYQWHQQIYDLKGVKWYVGLGAHANAFPGHVVIPDHYVTQGRSPLVPGFDGMLGLEYFFRYLPLQVTVDWKPEYNFVMGRRWYYFNSAISIRYRL